MNARIINLRTRRKQKARDEKTRKAVDRVARGKVARADRDTAEANEEARVTRLDGHRIDRPTDAPTTKPDD